MKTLLLAAFIATTSFTSPVPQSRPDVVQGSWSSDAHNYWTRNNNERWVSIQLERGDREHNGFSVPERDVPALTDSRGDGPVHFTLKRDAGSFDFSGDMRAGRASGDFRFQPDQGYVTGMAQLGYNGLSTEDVWRFAMFDITRTYASDFRNAGYRLDTEDLVKTRIHGATPAFVQEVKQEGLGQPPIDDLIKMRIHGVSPEFIRGMRDLGYKDLTIDQLVQLRIHGITSDYVKQMRDAGFKDQPLDRLVQFRIHGVSPEFIKSFTDLGYKNLAADDLVKMRIHGVSTEFVKQLNDLGYKNLDIDDLVKLRIHGVTPEYIKQMREVGYGKGDVDELVRFRIHQVDAQLVRDLTEHGFKNLSSDDLVDFAIHGRRWLKRGE